jgi:hypothetical protein
VLTHRNGAQRAAGWPAPVTVGKRPQPAFTAGQQDRPSLTTWPPGASSRLASVSTSGLRQPLALDGEAVGPVGQEPGSLRWPVGVSLSRRGLRSAPRASMPARCGADGSLAP